MGLISTWIEKGKKIKSRGIALTHKDQGYSANNRPVSLLMKSDISPDNLTVDVVKALEQVQLSISMEDFLRKFFDMWSDDAELLTKLLGFETKLEYDAANSPDDDWLQDWNKRHQEYLDDKLTTMTILKKAKNGEELTLKEQYDLIETRKSFEEGCEDLNISFSEEPSKTKPVAVTKNDPVVSKGTDVDKSTVVVTNTKSSPGANTTTIEETPVEKDVDVSKSAAFIEMQKAFEAQTEMMKSMQGDLVAAQEIIKAQKVAKRAVAIEKAAGFTFVAEEQRDAIADVIENPEQATLVAVLEKAAADLKAKDVAIAAKDKEIEDVKKSFADGKEVGAGGELTDAAKGSQDAQAKLDAVIKARKAEIEKANSKTTA